MTTLDLARRPDQGAAPSGHRWLMPAVLLGGQFMALARTVLRARS
jgi:hypothetical protein